MIVLKQRFRPFSMLPGSFCQIPGSDLFLEAYPTLIRIRDSHRRVVREQAIDLVGPVSRFLVMQDLHRGGATVFSGPYHLNISVSGEILRNRTFRSAIKETPFLSFGVHKQQDWQMIYRRRDLKEILPLWYGLGNITPHSEEDGEEETLRLFKECVDYRFQSDYSSTEMLALMEKLFLVGFGPCMVPRCYDDSFQGILTHFKKVDRIPLKLISQGAALIESLVLSRSSNRIEVLKKLPRKFFCGKLVGIVYPGLCSLDLEWTKHRVRMIRIQASVDDELYLSFPTEIQNFRLRIPALKDHGKTVSSGEPIAIKSGMTYVLDHFEK